MRYNNDKYHSTLPKAFTIQHYEKKKSLINETWPHNHTSHKRCQYWFLDTYEGILVCEQKTLTQEQCQYNRKRFVAISEYNTLRQAPSVTPPVSLKRSVIRVPLC